MTSNTVQIAYITHSGEVLLVLSQPCVSLGLKPAAAHEMAQALIKMADEIEAAEATKQ